jgi:hypothetical protein
MVGNVYSWLKFQVVTSPNKLLHGVLLIITTGFSFLYGCTAVIILSRKRMYMMHIWKSPTIMTPQLVDTDVLNVLFWGTGGVPQALHDLRAPGQDFENTPANNLRAFIITPHVRDSFDTFLPT